MEPLADLTLDVSRSIFEHLLPFARSMNAPRSHPLLGFIDRPAGIKAIQVLSDVYDSSCVVGDEVPRVSLGSGVSFLISTVGGYVLKAKLEETLQALESSSAAASDSSGLAWRLVAITNAGHCRGPAIDMAQHQTVPGLCFSLASDQSLLAWLTTRCDGPSGFAHKLIGCLQFQKLPSAIGLSPALVKAEVEGTSEPRVNSTLGAEDMPTSSERRTRSPLRVVHLAVGFEDGSVLEQSLALRVHFDENSEESSRPGETLEALWWEERKWHSGAKSRYQFSEVGGAGDDVSNCAMIFFQMMLVFLPEHGIHVC